MKTLQKFGLLFCFFVPLVKLAPPSQQQSATFYGHGLAALEDTTPEQDYEDTLFKDDYEDKPQNAVKNKENNGITVLHENELQMQMDEDNPRESTNYTDLGTCLLCACLSGSVYCEETDIDSVPALPKETGYLYARFNKIKKVKASDFSEIPTLRRIDLTGNAIQEIEDGSFSKLLLLEELSLAENMLKKLPPLPPKLISLNVNHNKITNRGIKANAFKKLTNLSYLYLGHNSLESVPVNLPESLRILHLQFNNITSITDETFCKANNVTRYVRVRLDEVRMEGNPVILAKYPNAFMCLKNLPIGTY